MDGKQWGIAAHYYATCLYRRWANRRAERQGQAPLLVLFYHRVADTVPNDWTISRQQFADQLDWLAGRFEMVSFAETCARLQQGVNYRPTACITFDDGYADNASYALPLLIERRIPCTYFVATQHVLQGLPFPHDLAVGQSLAPNTPEEIKEFARAGIEMGAHTRHHVDLGALTSFHELRQEIEGSRDDLRGLSGTSPRHLAFPYGQPWNFSRAAITVARDAGFTAVCSAYGGYNLPNRHASSRAAFPIVQRIHGDPDFVRFRNWMTIDPRKKRLHPPLDYQIARQPDDSHRLPQLQESSS